MTEQPPTANPQVVEPGTKLDVRQGGLSEHERAWRDRQPWLEERGYLLRPRYRLGWKPSWVGTKKHYSDCEDGQSTFRDTILDAIRKADRLPVTLKQIDTEVHPFEVEIGQFLSSEPLVKDSRNRCVPILDAFQDPSNPKMSIIVMPLLLPYDDPTCEFLTVGEAVAFFKQAFEGLHFMHDQHIAHRDISILNVMLDAKPMYRVPWHPIAPLYNRNFTGRSKHYSRTERPPRYYYIDFGLSRKYTPDDGPPRELPILGGDKSVPEFQDDGYNKPSDPFATDIYYLGNLIRTTFLDTYLSLEFMTELVSDMVQADPTKRPTIADVEARFDKISSQLSYWKLRGRLVHQGENGFARVVLSTMHFFRTVKFVVKRCPPVPMPQS